MAIRGLSLNLLAVFCQALMVRSPLQKCGFAKVLFGCGEGSENHLLLSGLVFWVELFHPILYSSDFMINPLSKHICYSPPKRL